MSSDAPKPRSPRRWPIAAPVGHFNGFASPEIWARMLLDAGFRVPPRYWLRLVWALFSSVCGFLITLPERLILAPILRLKFRGDRPTFAHDAGVVIVLGYFRSGTTHLHNLLSCDERFVTPRWRHCVAPHGFWVSWTILRALFIPFVPNTRPHDDVPFGPDWPGEDDFAVCNWTLASSLPGRFVLTRRRAHWARYHTLENLSPREHRNWRWATGAFLWKLSRADRSRPILLKSPSHLARVRDLVDLLGAERVRFVHIGRDPEAVIRSNVSMHERLEPMYGLQDPPPEGETREYLIDEYHRSVVRFAEQSENCAARVSRVRFQDLVADPLGELERAYGEMGLEWTPEVGASVTRYLHEIGTYTPRHSKGEADRPAREARLEEIARLLDIDRPAIERKPLPSTEREVSRSSARGWAALLLTTIALGAIWLPLAWAAGNRMDLLIWPAGLIIGMATIRAARVGSLALGLGAAGLTLGLYVAVVYPATWLAYGHGWKRPAYDSWLAIRNSLLTRVGVDHVALAIGVLTAFRVGTRKHLRPPGR